MGESYPDEQGILWVEYNCLGKSRCGTTIRQILALGQESISSFGIEGMGLTQLEE